MTLEVLVPTPPPYSPLEKKIPFTPKSFRVSISNGGVCGGPKTMTYEDEDGNYEYYVLRGGEWVEE